MECRTNTELSTLYPPHPFAPSSPDEFPVLDSVWLVSVRTLSTLQVLDVTLVVAFVPDRLAVALECQDVRRNTVEEPPVVRDDDGAAGKVEERYFKRAQRVDV